MVLSSALLKFKSEEFEGVAPGPLWQYGHRNAEDVLGTVSIGGEGGNSVFAGREAEQKRLSLTDSH